MICIAGSLSTMLAAIALAKWLHLPNDIIRALAIKSVTAAVAVQTAPPCMRILHWPASSSFRPV